MDGDGGESTQQEQEVNKSYRDWDEVDGMKDGAGSRDKVKRIESNDQSVNRNKDDVDGRARVTRDEERVLRGG